MVGCFTEQQRRILDLILRLSWGCDKTTAYIQRDFEVVGVREGHVKTHLDWLCHAYDAVLIWALDRLTHEGIAKMLEWVNTFKAYGVKVVSLNESWADTTGPMAELLYAVCAWAAEYESKRKSERVKVGLARAVKCGSKLGRPKGAKDKKPRRKAGYYLRYARDK
jgi:DNA invertase Pin-like site-specific DNA recombinase